MPRLPTATEEQLNAGALKKFAAEQRYYDHLADKTKIETTFAQDIRTEVDASQHVARLYSFNGGVTDSSANGCIQTIGQWQREDASKPITLVFNSPGGGVHSGLALYDYIHAVQATGTTIDTHSIGWAASMGGILLQAGAKRTMGAHAYMLIHEISSGAIGNTSELEDELKFVKRLQERCLAILAERSTLSKRQISRRWQRKDWWLDATEALEFGFIDEIA